jgi:hypothetical protein
MIWRAGIGKIRAIAATTRAAIPIAPAIKKVGNGTTSSITHKTTPIINHIWLGNRFMDVWANVV